MSLIHVLQATVDGAEQAATNGVKEVPLWDILQDSNAGIGWLVNLLLVIMFGYTIFVFVERYLAIKRASSGENKFISQVKTYLKEGNVEMAKQLCRSSNSPSARIIEKGIERLGKPIETITAAIENTGKLEVSKLEQRVSFFSHSVWCWTDVRILRYRSGYGGCIYRSSKFCFVRIKNYCTRYYDGNDHNGSWTYCWYYCFYGT